MPALPVDPENIHTELEHMEAIIKSWREAVGNGIPAVDQPAPEEALDDFLRKFTGELIFVAGKCQNLAVVLSER